MRVLLCAATTGYQVRAFDAAADELGVELQLATDRCHVLEDPWRDRAIPVRFHDPARSLEAVRRLAAERRLHGVLAVGDDPAVIAAHAARALGLPWHSPEAAEAARQKLQSRRRLAKAGLPVPEFGVWSADSRRHWEERLPVVVKPAALAGSRGVIRADTPAQLEEAVARVGRILDAPELRARPTPEGEQILVERFIPGREFAVEGAVDRGRFRPFAIFDKPDPLDGPYFEETIYVTPSRAPSAVQQAILDTVPAACRALGLEHGPVHAECRVNGEGVFMLEAAARPIGGLCARALRFEGFNGVTSSLEALLLGHACGLRRLDDWRREEQASGVMMIPIPAAGVFRGVDGVREAEAVPGIESVEITARPDQQLLPLPEGATYLGFIFARGASPQGVEDALRAAHARLRIRLDRPVPVIPAP
ncbi:MAG TPA: ATP-grasp domain-containing protein [Vicinamibacterales bacterium]